MCKLLAVTGLCFLFMIAEVIGGYVSGSIAIITDAAHMLSDVAGFLISYFAIYMGSRPGNYKMSFGYHRAEILGALASVLLIWGLIIWLFVEAIHRIVDPEEIDGTYMLITACVGLVFNFISIFTLHSCGGGHHHHHDHEHDHAHEEKEGEKKLSHCHQPEFVKMNENKRSSKVLHEGDHEATHDEDNSQVILHYDDRDQNK